MIDALVLNEVSFRWPGQAAFSLTIPAFRLEAGERVLMIGESGSGKSTLLSLVCGILPPDSGSIVVEGAELAALRQGQRDRFRAEKIGVIFQQFNLLPYARVMDNILLPLRFAPERRRRAGDQYAEAARLCRALGLASDVLSVPARRLSVGQQQRVAAARALIGRPPLVVADEPTSALDARTQGSFLALLFDQAAKAGSSVLMVSHDERLEAHFDRVVRLEDIVATKRAAA